MLKPTRTLRGSSVCSPRFAHTHLVRGGSLMLEPEDPVLAIPVYVTPAAGTDKLADATFIADCRP